MEILSAWLHPDSRTATSALLAIDAKWEEIEDHPSNANIFDYLVKNTSQEKDERGW
jgi:hypothetical protein